MFCVCFIGDERDFSISVYFYEEGSFIQFDWYFNVIVI